MRAGSAKLADGYVGVDVVIKDSLIFIYLCFRLR